MQSTATSRTPQGSLSSVGHSPFHIADIDGLRALAVLAVVVFHFSASSLPGGFVGVDVFFVISGYVVTSSLLRRPHSNARKYFTDFYARRLIRIYPALLFCVLITALAYTMLVPQAQVSGTNAKTGIASLFGLSNFALILFDDGYFSPRVEYNAFTHTWSLAVEEQFYLLFPLLLWVYLSGGRRGWPRNILGLGVLCFAFTASLFYAAWESNSSPTRAYYLLPSRFWELAVGALIAICQIRNLIPIFGRVAANFFTAAGILGIIAASFITEKTGFPYPGALLPVFSSALVILGVFRGNSDVSHFLLGNRVAAYIGKISYSLYLWHWPVIVLTRWTIGTDSAIALLAAAAISFSLAITSYHLIENPVRTSQRINNNSSRSILLVGLALICISALVASAIFSARSILSLSVTKDSEIWRPDTIWTDSSELDPKLPTLYLLGDSHAWAYSDMAVRLRIDGLSNVVRYSLLGCSATNLRKPADADCLRRTKQAISDIKASAKPGDFVLLASLRTPRIGEQLMSFDQRTVLAEQRSSAAISDRGLAYAQASDVVRDLKASGIVVIMDAPKPVFPAPAFRCSDWFNRSNPICAPGLSVDRTFLRELTAPTTASLQRLQTEQGVIVWDAINILCPGSTCSAFSQGKPLFFDGDHMTGYAAQVLYPHFKSLLVSNKLISAN